MRCRLILQIATIVFMSCLAGCATSVGKASNASTVPDSQLSVLATASASTKIDPSEKSMFFDVDGEFFLVSAWKVLVAPGSHTITLRNNSINKSYEIEVLPGKHYDILYSGNGYMRDRDPSKDSMFIGGATSDYEPLVVDSWRAVRPKIVPKSVIVNRAREERLRDEQYRREHATEIAARNANYEAMRKAQVAEQVRQNAVNSKLVKTKGQKICRSVEGTLAMPLGQAYDGQIIYGKRLPTTYYVTAFTENSTESKIQFRVSSVYRMEESRLINVDKLGGETVYQTNAVMWDDPIAWSPCK